MQSVSVTTKSRTEFVDVTRKVQEATSGTGIRNGVLTVYVPHTTAGITINENADPDVMADLGQALEQVVPWQAAYRHSEGNAAAHVKASMMGSSVQVPVREGRLQLGTWQGIYLCEFDGPRTRQVWVAWSR
jgi:secondary thiamine-phosphate synthase enzyme